MLIESGGIRVNSVQRFKASVIPTVEGKEIICQVEKDPVAADTCNAQDGGAKGRIFCQAGCGKNMVFPFFIGSSQNAKAVAAGIIRSILRLV